MSQILQDFGNQYCKEAVPVLKPGYLVKVHQKIKEGSKERVQVFQGTVIKTNAGHGVNDTFTVRKISEGIGVEKVFPIHAPSIIKIEVLRAHKVRRSNLGYLRKLSGKALRLKEIPLKLKEKTFPKPVAKVEKEEVIEGKEEASTEK
jgi:large subunit ribosomal protein L19